jgi:hypothetical protein
LGLLFFAAPGTTVWYLHTSEEAGQATPGRNCRGLAFSPEHKGREMGTSHLLRRGAGQGSRRRGILTGWE